MRHGASKTKITIASIVGSVLTLQLGAFSVTLETMASGVTSLPFSTFIAAMQPIHLAIGLVEGLITAVVLCFIYEARPELLWGVGESAVQQKEGKLSFKKTLIILSAAAIVIAGGLSLVASANPDGLEWSIEKITGSTEVEADGGVYETAENIQSSTAILPDYAFKNSDSQLGTSFSGIAGGLVVVAVCVGACYAFRFFRKKKVRA